MLRSTADVVQEDGPFEGVDAVHGVTWDGRLVWFASSGRLNAFDPRTRATVRSIAVAADAGTAFDGRHLFQVAGDRILEIDPVEGRVLADIPLPCAGASGLTWAEGSLWVGEYRARRIHRIDPADGRVLAVIESDRFVTGVTWADGDLWHATWEDDASELRRVDPGSGAVLEAIAMPAGATVSGLESDGGDRFFCGGGASGTLRTVRRPRR